MLFDDSQVEGLAGLKALECLFIRSREFTDARVDCLRGLTQLKYLWLLDTKVTEGGLKRLRDALPGCEIDCRQDAYPDPEYLDEGESVSAVAVAAGAVGQAFRCLTFCVGADADRKGRAGHACG